MTPTAAQAEAAGGRDTETFDALTTKSSVVATSTCRHNTHGTGATAVTNDAIADSSPVTDNIAVDDGPKSRLRQAAESTGEAEVQWRRWASSFGNVEKNSSQISDRTAFNPVVNDLLAEAETVEYGFVFGG
jgi:hypothetical protein